MGSDRPAAPADLPLRLNTYPARAGLQWVRQGLRLFAGAPLVLVVLVGLGPLLLSTLQVVVPLLGEFLAYWLAPAAAVGVLNVCRDVRAGATPGVGSYVRVLHEPLARLRLLQLGIYYALFAGLFSLLVNLLAPAPAAATAVPGAAPTPLAGAASPGATPTMPPVPTGRGPDTAATNAVSAAPPPPDSAVDAPAGPPDAAGATASPTVAPAAPTPAAPAAGGADAAARSAAPAAAAGPAATPVPARSAPGAADAPLPKLPPLALALLAMIGVPFAMTIWFAPPLVGWYRMPVAKALFFSFFACWRNRGALLVYLLALLGLGALGLLLLGALIDLINAREGLAPFLLMAPLVFLMLAIFQSAHLMMVEAVIEPGAPAPSTVQQN